MQKFDGQNLQTAIGNARPNERVLIQRADTAATATIYEDDETTTITQDASFQTDADGQLPGFKARNGEYLITFPNSSADDFGPVLLFDPTDNSDSGQTDFDIYTFNKLRLAGTGEASEGGTGHVLQVGATTGTNLMLDGDEISAQDNGIISHLRLQALATADNSAGYVVIGAANADQVILELRQGDDTTGEQFQIQAIEGNTTNAREIHLNPDGGNIMLGSTGAGDYSLAMKFDTVSAIQSELAGAANTLELNPDGGQVRIATGGGDISLGGAGAGEYRVFCDLQTGVEMQAQLAGANTTLALNPDGGDVTVNGANILSGGAVSSGSWSPTWTGFSSDPAGTVSYQVTDPGWCTMRFNLSSTGTSNATTMSITDAPAAVRPANQQKVFVRAIDAGGLILGVAQVETSGVINFLTLDNTSWTNPGAKGLDQNSTITYAMDA